MPQPDYYSLLEVSSHATVEQIKQSYRRLARKYHPDMNRSGDDIRIKQLNEAYDVLSNAAKRTSYDIQRLEELRTAIILETIRIQRERLLRERKMTWREGMAGFVTELKKNMRNE